MLGVEPDVLKIADEQIDAGRLRLVEQERLAERELIVRGAAPLLRGHREGFAAAKEVRRLERELTKEAVVLRHAGAEGQLVAVLLLELQLDVDLVVGPRRLLDANCLALERLEVAELIQTLDAVFQRLGVEHAALDETYLPANNVISSRRIAGEGNAVDEILLAFLKSERDVDDRRPFRRGGRGAGPVTLLLPLPFALAPGSSRGARSGNPVKSMYPPVPYSSLAFSKPLRISFSL